MYPHNHLFAALNYFSCMFREVSSSSGQNCCYYVSLRALCDGCTAYKGQSFSSNPLSSFGSQDYQANDAKYDALPLSGPSEIIVHDDLRAHPM
jgi:hypothetical protein